MDPLCARCGHAKHKHLAFPNDKQCVTPDCTCVEFLTQAQFSAATRVASAKAVDLRRARILIYNEMTWVQQRLHASANPMQPMHPETRRVIEVAVNDLDVRLDALREEIGEES